MQIDSRLKEKVYVHTNKTSYFPDDIIWFKAYVGDSINYPSTRTKILEVRLFDENGDQMFARTISITDGTGLGQFELNDAIAPGTYYLQARTNYMRNFGEEYQYLQEITILGEKSFNISKEESLKYDIQLFPESGNLVEDIENTLGIKALLNGKSIDFQGSIINGEGETITTFQSEHEGLGRFSFVYKKGETYRARIKVKDTVLEQAVPAASEKGVVLSIDNSDEEFLQVNLKVNEATFYNQIYSNYTLLYHQDRQLFQLYSVARLDSVTSLIKTRKNVFLDGVHTLTLFADDRPIAQRKFYIETGRKKALIFLEKSKIDADSVSYRLLSRGRKKNLNADLSISILHKKSKAVHLKNTIKSAFLLRPHVRGYIENPAYYFNIENEKRKEHLDLLLLTQGWTGYTLDEIIKEINPIEKYAFKTGFELKGKISEETKRKKLVLIPDDLRIIDKAKLQDKSTFVFQDLSVFKGDTVRVAYQNWLGKISKPLKIEYDTASSRNRYRLSIAANKNYKADHSGKTAQNGVTDWTNDTPFGNVDGTIDLDEVIVTERKRSEQYVRRRKTIEKYEPLVSDIGKYYDLPISQVLNNSSSYLMDFFVQQGYHLRTKDNVNYYLQGLGGVGFLFINGRPVRSTELLSVQLQMKDIENIMVNNLGYKNGTGISFFQVFTSDTFGENKNTLFNKFVIKNGFDRAKKYYTPMYASERSRPIDFMEVDWKPNLITNNKGEASFKIARKDSENGLLFKIQGFSSEGHLISKTILTD
ncbi:hypothetical protein D7Z94_19740 [Ulvibacterium marinum]|uniref:Macroglobulin domain-containing protein n=1 Tax=Ulvibacterium marinum TaxID=2419782 RepID=A0A3B0BZQ9_9FLAO|nr:hypothetical protein D7Z94_19740 [Ulvibacterium marinum]